MFNVERNVFSAAITHPPGQRAHLSRNEGKVCACAADGALDGNRGGSHCPRRSQRAAGAGGGWGEHGAGLPHVLTRVACLPRHYGHGNSLDTVHCTAKPCGCGYHGLSLSKSKFGPSCSSRVSGEGSVCAPFEERGEGRRSPRAAGSLVSSVPAS